MPLVAPFVESIGYDGTIGEGELAVWGASLGPLPVVLSHQSWRVRAVPGLPEPTIEIAAGVGTGDAVRDTTDAPFRMTIPVPAGTAERWDTIVCRRDWRPTPDGTSAFVRVAGGSSRFAFPASLAKEPGVLSDHIIARVGVRGGSTAVQGIDDLRVVSSPQYGLLSDFAAGLGRGMGEPPAGTEILKPNGERFRYWPDAAGSLTAQSFVERGGLMESAAGAMYTTRDPSPVRKLPNGAPDPAWRVWNSSPIAIGRILVPNPGRPYRLALDCEFWAGAEPAGTRFDFFARAGSATGAQLGRALAVPDRAVEKAVMRSITTTPYNTVFEGAQEIFIVAERVFGTGRGEFHAPSALLRATPYAA